ncbi:MAG: type II toxin-antitoxin system VapC family toxin [Candidatus Brocadiia bacterium]
MSRVLVDSNVFLDIMTEDERWYEWSAATLERAASDGIICINPIIYGEVSVRFDGIEELEDALPGDFIERLPVPYEAAFLAGKCYLKDRRRGGKSQSPLPDFLIGAHAAVLGIPLATRDDSRYRTYFPQLELLAPDR